MDLARKDRSDGSSGLVRGLALVYVDDLLVLGDPQVVEEATKRVSQTWETTEPHWAGEDPLRFCHLQKYGGLLHQPERIPKGATEETLHRLQGIESGDEDYS